MVKYAGAGYLIYLGVKTLRDRGASNQLQIPGATTVGGAFKRGVIVNVLNPKLALFFLAFLPQFVVPAGGSAAIQLVFLGFLFIAVAIVIDGVYAVMSGMIGNLLNRNERFTRIQSRLAATYVALGATAAVTASNSK